MLVSIKKLKSKLKEISKISFPATQLTQNITMLQNITPPKLPKWFSTDALNCYVMLHDASFGEITK